MTEWKTWTPEYDGHAPDDWDAGIAQLKDFRDAWQNVNDRCFWGRGGLYRYRAKKPDLLAQCLALPQADREALIEALQKPVRDWADDVAEQLWTVTWGPHETAVPQWAAVIRSMCRPKEEEIDAEELFFDIIEESGYDAQIREGALDDKDKAAIRLIREALS